jgi:hypothetical protein
MTVTVTGAVDVTRVGGFAAEFNTDVTGGANADWTINNCYAAGPVTVAVNSSSQNVRVGGFTGSMGVLSGDFTTPEQYRDVHINNCYALGNVTLTHNGTGNASAGGFAGVVAVPSGNLLEHCFAAGEVKLTSSTGGEAYAGGLVGYWGQGIIRNCAALGASVQATGTTQGAGRVYGYSSGGGGSVSNNYANSSMYVGAGSPAIITSGAGPATMHGADTVYTFFANAYWWRNSPGFDTANWDFTNTPYKFYPAVKDSAGNVLEGQ